MWFLTSVPLMGRTAHNYPQTKPLCEDLNIAGGTGRGVPRLGLLDDSQNKFLIPPAGRNPSATFCCIQEQGVNQEFTDQTVDFKNTSPEQQGNNQENSTQQLHIWRLEAGTLLQKAPASTHLFPKATVEAAGKRVPPSHLLHVHLIGSFDLPTKFWLQGSWGNSSQISKKAFLERKQNG